jgi:hypothetical protein
VAKKIFLWENHVGFGAEWTKYLWEGIQEIMSVAKGNNIGEQSIKNVCTNVCSVVRVGYRI